MCEPTTVAALATAGALANAKGAYDQAKVNRGIARNNMALAEASAQDAERRGELEAQAANRRGRQVMGAQRATLAARGLDMDVGTAADLVDETNFFMQVDAATARTNGRKEAWASRVQGVNYRAQANANNPWRAATLSLLASAPSVASSWQKAG